LQTRSLNPEVLSFAFAKQELKAKVKLKRVAVASKG
jgi:hypothetical protein